MTVKRLLPLMNERPEPKPPATTNLIISKAIACYFNLKNQIGATDP